MRQRRKLHRQKLFLNRQIFVPLKEVCAERGMSTEKLYEMLKIIQTSMSSMNESIASLNGKMTDMQSEMGKIGEFKISLEHTQASLENTKEEVKDLSSKMNQYNTALGKVSSQLAESRRENRILNEKLLQMDICLRRENLIFSGIAKERNESAAATITKLQNLFVNQLQIGNGNVLDYQRCHRLGPKDANKTREIIIRFTRFQDRELVWRKRKLLKGTNVYVKEDFPPEVNRKRSQLYPILLAARNSNKKATLVADRLFIENRKYTVDTVDTLPPELHPNMLSQRSTDDCIVFYGRNSVFSNFYSTNFTIEGITYNSCEQYHQYKKALRAGENDLAVRILETDDPTVQYKIGKRLLINDDHWKNVVSKQVLQAAVKAKFEQNQDLKNLLLSTQNKMLAECNQFDKVWGTGLKLNSAEALDRTKWQGENALGNILITVRDDLKK
jgi:ribA/ribD-fused uncharacterized protein